MQLKERLYNTIQYNPNTWATHIEVLAIAAYFQVPVYFCTDPSQPSTGGTYRWECFNPIASRELLRYPILTEPLFEGANSIRHLELVYYRNCHYNSIVSIHTGVLHVSPPQLNWQHHLPQPSYWVAAFLYMHSKSIVFFSMYTYLAVWPLNSGMIDSHCSLTMLGQSANSNYMTSSGMKRARWTKWIPTVSRIGV